MSKLRFLLFVLLIFILGLSACTPAEPVANSDGGVSTDVEQAEPSDLSEEATSEEVQLAESIVLINTGGDWGECQRKTFADTFEAVSGVKVIDGPFLDDGQIRAAVESGVYDVDVVFPTPSLVLDELGSQYLEPIDYSLVQKDDLIEGTYTEYGVALDLFSWAFGYRTDTGVTPTSWADFYDVENFPGKRGLVSWDTSTVLIGALLADGVAPEELLPLDIERALAKLDTIRDEIVWFDTGSAGQDLLITGEVAYIQLYANRITSSRNEGHAVDIIWDGQIIQADYLGIPKGSPNVATAQKLIAHMVSREVNGQFSFCQPGAPSNAFAEVNPEISDELPTSHMDGLFVISSNAEISEYMEKNIDEITNAFNDWKAGQ